MPAPSTAQYSVAALVAAHTALLELIDAAASPGLIRLRSASDVLLAEMVLGDPAGAVNGITGQLTLTIVAQESAAPSSGDIAYGQVCDGDGLVHLAMPAKAGAAAESGWFVCSSLSVTTGNPVNVLSAVIG